MNDYERIAKIIRYLDKNYPEQPSLETLAGVAGLSASHFHRLFSTWVGISPKDFVQFLTLEHAKKLLNQGRPVLDSALESGLSGSGRLHDLTVSLEAASPGEIKNGGKGIKIRYGFAITPLGHCLIAESERGLCRLVFVEKRAQNKAIHELSNDWPNADLFRCDEDAERLAKRIFVKTEIPKQGLSIHAFVKGTSFQLQVWRALLRIRPGHLVSYGRLAQAIGNPTAARAVGAAVGANPISILIPCHRVIQETGAIGGYRWGIGRKRLLLAWETCSSGHLDSKQE